MSSIYHRIHPDPNWHATGRPDIPVEIDETGISVGALPLGTAAYDIPIGAIFLATTGSDSNPGTQASPKATLAGCISAATSGDTIVIRGGEYRQNAGQTNKQLTIQNYPGEAVWFDGTDVVTSWTQDGATWWTPTLAEFSHLAGHSQNSPDPASRWTDALNPVAHWTDLVFIDGVRQWKVAANPGPGQFTVNYATHRVIIGSNPAGKNVRVGRRTKMLHVSATCTIRGIGWRRYCTEMWELGTVYIATAGAGSLVENCHMDDCATQPLCVLGSNSIVQDVTIRRPGQTGVHVNRSDNSVFRRMVVRDFNWEKFRTQPHCGAIKITFAGNTSVEDSWFDGASNRANAVWYDASCWGGHITNNYAQNGRGGFFVEASGNMIVAGNRFFGNADSYQGFLLTIAQDIQTWNNYADRANGYLFANWQDSRQAPQGGERFWAEGLRWHSVRNSWYNNVMGGSHSLYMFYNRRDAAAAAYFDYNTMVTDFDGNVFASAPGQNPPVGASRLAGYVQDGSETAYSTLTAFETARTYADNNKMTTLQTMTDDDMAGFTGAVALPANVATLLRVPTGTVVTGPPKPAPVPREAA